MTADHRAVLIAMLDAHAIDDADLRAIMDAIELIERLAYTQGRIDEAADGLVRSQRAVEAALGREVRHA